MQKVDLSEITLLGARLLIELCDEPDRTQSGIYVPSELLYGHLAKGRVVKVGIGEYNNAGVLIKPEVSEGDIVYFDANHGGEFMGHRMIHWYAVEAVEPANS